MPPARVPVIERLLRRVVVDSNGCWNWTGATDAHGYGQISRGGREGMVKTHRVTYFCFVGPTELGLDHLCRNRACCNPSHLEPVSQGENVRRGDHCYRDDGRPRECPKGHAMTPDNKRKDGRCRTCINEWKRAAYAARKVVMA